MTAENREKGFVSAQRVAELAGVSRSAVSRTFTEGASVSEATRQKVLKAAEALGYHVNHLARSLIHERSDLVCLVASDIDTPFRSSLIEALTRRMQRVGKVAMIVNTEGQGSGVESALRQTLNYRAAATVVLSGTPSASLIETCIANGQHVILLNRNDDIVGPQKVMVDSRDAAGEAFFMLRRAGCERLAVVSSTARTPSLVLREQAFLEAAQSAGLNVPILRSGSTTYESGAAAARDIFSRPGTPDGVFCVTDLLACGFIDTARYEFKLEVPTDLCVVGFDDIDQASWASYELTTFRQPVEQVAEHIVQLIIDGGTASAVQFQPEPVWRKSVRPRP